MTAPDPTLLAAAIEHMEAEIALFPEAEFPVEHEWTRAVVAAVRANVAMREALSEFLAWFDRQNDGMEGIHYLNGDSDKYAGNGHDDLKKVGSIARAALSKAGV